jgi:hypothetical protein
MSYDGCSWESDVKEGKNIGAIMNTYKKHLEIIHNYVIMHSVQYSFQDAETYSNYSAQELHVLRIRVEEELFDVTEKQRIYTVS